MMDSRWFLTGRSLLFAVVCPTFFACCARGAPPATPVITCYPEKSQTVYSLPASVEARILDLAGLIDSHGNCHLFWIVVTKPDDTDSADTLWHAVWGGKSGTSKSPRSTSLAGPCDLMGYSVRSTGNKVGIVWRTHLGLVCRWWNEATADWEPPIAGAEPDCIEGGNSFFFTDPGILFYHGGEPVTPERWERAATQQAETQEVVHPFALAEARETVLRARPFIGTPGARWGKDVQVLRAGDPFELRMYSQVFANSDGTFSIFAERSSPGPGGSATIDRHVYDPARAGAAEKRGEWRHPGEWPFQWWVFPVRDSARYYLFWRGKLDPRDTEEFFWSVSDTSGTHSILTKTRFVLCGSPVASFRPAGGSDLGIVAWNTSLGTGRVEAYVLRSGAWFGPLQLNIASGEDMAVLLTALDRGFFVVTCERGIRFVPFEIGVTDGEGDSRAP